MKDQIINIINYIQHAAEALPESQEANKNRFLELVDNAVKALGYAEDNKDSELYDEKMSFLYNMVTVWANQVAFILFRGENDTEELIKEFRSFEPVEDTTESYQKYVDDRNEVGEKIQAERDEFLAKEREVEIFKAVVVRGMSPEDAAKRQAEYEEEMRKAQQGK